MRDFLLRALVVLAATTAILTEALSAFHQLRRGVLVFAWLLIASVAFVCLRGRRSKVPPIVFHPFETAVALVIGAILLLVGVTAGLSAPNSFDALAYHMPRIVYWAQAGSVEFFPTSYLAQISFPPLAEYLMLQTYVITGGDRLVNFVSLAAFGAAIVGVSSIASVLGATSRGQAMAALFCATLPGAILQASGPKNDLVLALWLVCAVYFGLQRQVILCGLSFGLALATKGTAYVFAPPLFVAILALNRYRGRSVPWLALTVGSFGAVLLINAPQYWRNWQLSGSPLGYNSPFGDDTFPFRNGRLGWRPTFSNVLRHASEQIGTRNPRWNKAVYDGVVKLHALLGVDPQDPESTWQWSRYAPPENTRHESNANNRWSLVVLCAAYVYAIAVAWKRRDAQWLLYGTALLSAFLLFCFYLRWQPYGARLFVPLFILGAPLAGVLMESIRPKILALGICVFLIDGARLPLLENWTRPLRGPGSVLAIGRSANYFADIGSMNNRDSYMQPVDLIARSGCDIVGIDTSKNQLEYPFQALLLERNPKVRFQHVGVQNASARFNQSVTPKPCAVLCLDCLDDQSKTAMYRDIGPAITTGRFLLFLKHLI